MGRQLGLFASQAVSPASGTGDERQAAAVRKKAERAHARRAFFADRACALASPSTAVRPSGKRKRVLDREAVIGMLCAEDVEIWDIARRAGVSERFVMEILADSHDRKARVRSAIAILRALESLPATAPSKVRSARARP